MDKKELDDFIESMNIDAETIFLEVEGCHTSLYDFIFCNLCEKDIEWITLEDAQRVVTLQIGQSIFVNIIEVKRIS